MTASVVWWSEYLATELLEVPGFDSRRFQLF
jgi:hypothetical protein